MPRVCAQQYSQLSTNQLTQLCLCSSVLAPLSVHLQHTGPFGALKNDLSPHTRIESQHWRELSAGYSRQNMPNRTSQNSQVIVLRRHI